MYMLIANIYSFFNTHKYRHVEHIPVSVPLQNQYHTIIIR